MSLRFVFMADCQMGCFATFSGMDEQDVRRFAARGMRVEPTPAVTGHAWDAARYEQAVALANRLEPAFVVMGGDMVDDPLDGEQYATLTTITAGLDAPMRWVPGNHDVGPGGNAPTAAVLASYRDRFGPDTYAFTHGPLSAVVIDTPLWFEAEALPDEHAAAVESLHRMLAEASARPGPTVVFGHHPLFTARHDEPDSYWNIPGRFRRGLLDLFDRHGVTTYMAGHWHRNGGGRHRDLEVVVSGPVGYPLGVDPSGLRVVDVTPHGVRHHYVALDTDD